MLLKVFFFCESQFCVSNLVRRVLLISNADYQKVLDESRTYLGIILDLLRKFVIRKILFKRARICLQIHTYVTYVIYYLLHLHLYIQIIQKEIKNKQYFISRISM